MPVYAFLSNVYCNSPRFEQTPKRRKIRNSVVCNALATKSGQLNLRNIKPTPVLWRIMNLRALGKISGTLRREGGVQGCNVMGVEVIHYKNNLLGHRILLGQQPLYLLCPILSSPSLLGVGISPSRPQKRHCVPVEYTSTFSG